MSVFVLFEQKGGMKQSKLQKAFSIAEQEAKKREGSIPVSLPTIAGTTYSFLSGELRVSPAAVVREN